MINAARITYEFDCMWCGRTDSFTRHREDLSSLSAWPPGWHESNRALRRPDLCGADCKTEYVAAEEAAFKASGPIWSEAGALDPDAHAIYKAEIERLRQVAIMLRGRLL